MAIDEKKKNGAINESPNDAQNPPILLSLSNSLAKKSHPLAISQTRYDEHCSKKERD